MSLSEYWGKKCPVRLAIRTDAGSAIGVLAVTACVVEGFIVWWPLGVGALVAAVALVVMGKRA